MKRFLAAMVAALLMVTMVASVASADQGTITLTSATVSHSGQVVVYGTIDCTLYSQTGVGFNGQITEAIGHKTLLQTGLNGGIGCAPAGDTQFQIWAQANNGTFSQGWVTVSLWFFDPFDLQPERLPEHRGRDVLRRSSRTSSPDAASDEPGVPSARLYLCLFDGLPSIQGRDQKAM